MKLDKSTVVYGLIIAVILIILFVVQPIITSNIVLQKQKSDIQKEDQQKEDIFALKANLEIINNSYLDCISSKNQIQTQLNNQITDLQTQLNNQMNENLECSKDLEKEKVRYDNCNNNLEDKDSEISSLKDNLNSEISSLKNDLNACNQDKESFDETYDKLAKNSANIVCCFKKLENHNINYYDVENNKVICLESGDKEINCF